MSAITGWPSPDPAHRDHRLPTPPTRPQVTITTGASERALGALGAGDHGVTTERTEATATRREPSTHTDGSAWQLGWDPTHQTLYARHVTSSDRPNDMTTRWYGTTQGAYPTVAALEQQLGFALPDTVRRFLTTQTSAPAARPLDTVLEDRRPPDPGERPGDHDLVSVPGHEPATYAGAVADQPAVRVYTDRAHTLELLTATPTTVTGDNGSVWERWALTYRLRAGHRVIFAGDDITVPAAADPASDDTLRRLGWALASCPAGQPTATQHAWLADHGARFWAGLTEPAELTEGMHVEFDTADGPPALGRITAIALNDHTGAARGFYVRPDVAELPGHPWVDSDATMFVRPNRVREACLRDPDRGIDPTRPLPYLTQVIYRTFAGVLATGEVLRAFAATDDPTASDYDMRALDGPGRGLVTRAVPAGDLHPQQGAWWVGHHDLVAARLADDVGFLPGEVVQGVHDPAPLRVVAVAPDGTPQLQPAAGPTRERTAPMPTVTATTDLSALHPRALVTLPDDDRFDPTEITLTPGAYRLAWADGQVTLTRPDREPITVGFDALAAAHRHTGSIPAAADHAAGLDIDEVGL